MADLEHNLERATLGRIVNLSVLVATLVLVFVLLNSILPRHAVAEFGSNNHLGDERMEATRQFELTRSSGWDYSTVDTRATQDFRLRVPAAGINHAVVENVDPARESIYGPVIEKHVAHGKFTRLPDEATNEGNVYLFAHREGETRGRDVGFFRNLDRVGAGDKAEIRYAGKTYRYEFKRSFVVEPNETWVYTGRATEPTLTLQTCEDGETKRLIVQFKLVAVI